MLHELMPKPFLAGKYRSPPLFLQLYLFISVDPVAQPLFFFFPTRQNLGAKLRLNNLRQNRLKKKRNNYDLMIIIVLVCQTELK